MRKEETDPLHSYYTGLLDQARDYAIEYLKDMDARPVFPSPASLARLDALEEALPDAPSDPAEMLEAMHAVGGPATIAQLGGRYFGFVNGGALPAAVAARWLADVWDQNAALHVMAPFNAKLEEICEGWLTDILGLPDGTAASFVSGTSTALACAFVAARNELLRRKGWDAARQGLFGAPEIKVVVGEQTHATVYKALAFAGLGSERLTKCKTDDQGRIIAEEVPLLDDSTLLVLQAGNVNSGAFDPLEPLCRQARQAGAWVHIDGAFGLWAAASKTKRDLVTGYDLADSWALDAHKTLNAPYDSGLLLCRDRAALRSAMQASGSYIVESEHRDPMFYTLEMGRRARAVELWAILKTLGRQGVEGLVDQFCDHAGYVAAAMRQQGFRILNDVVFNQVLIAGADPSETTAILEWVQTSGELWCGGTLWHGEPAIRFSVCNWATTRGDLKRAVAAFGQARAAAAVSR